MKTIALCGTARGVGKTTVGAFLCRQLGGVAAVKVMPRYRLLAAADTGRVLRDDVGGEAQPLIAWADADAETESEAVSDAARESAGFLVVDDPSQLLQSGSDTRRFWDAGAEPVIWVRARDEEVLEAVAAVRAQVVAADRAVPGLLLVESDRYVRDGGEADVTLLVYPNGSEEVSDAALGLLAQADALVVAKRRPGAVKLALLDDERFPADKLDIPAFAFNLNEDSLALDDRYALVDWLRRRLDLRAVNADEACRVV